MSTERKRAWTVCLTAAALILTTAPAPADTLHVPAQYAVIQAAIDAAAPGDVVEIADDTYTGPGNKNLDFNGKAITVRGASGDPDLCVIDCESDGQGFDFHSGEGLDSIVEGLTITNGLAYAGGGVFCRRSSSPTLNNCRIIGNTASGNGDGGGVHCRNSSSPILNDCTISENTASGDGGGLYCTVSSSPTLTNSTLSENIADHGGGIYCGDSSDPTLNYCAIRENSADYGGGVYCSSHSTPTLKNCWITDNSAEWGGGAYCFSSDPTLNYCMIDGNLADWGGGAYCAYSNPTLTNCIISGNSASGGGGISIYDGDPTLTNCTISRNISHSHGGGVFCHQNSNPTLVSCMINGNIAYGEGGGVNCDDSCYPMLVNCTISGNTAYDHGGGIYCQNDCRPTLANCVISENSANECSGNGGGVWCCDSSPSLTNCTISRNSAASGGGIAIEAGSPTLTNCILWGDTPQEIHSVSGSPVVTHCDVQGGWTGEGNIDSDPLFAFASDFHLIPGSPCIDAGDNEPLGGLPADDLDENVRPLDGDGDTVVISDMGAFEYNPAAPVRIALDPKRIEFSAYEGGGAPPDQTLSIRNCGAGVLNWEVTGQPAWLTVSPPSGESSGEVDQVSLSVDISGLLYGSYVAVLEVVDMEAVNSPREVLVVLNISTTLYVPGEYSTIQAAIDASVIPGDVVVIADGTHVGAGNKNLDFGGKAIKVRGASGDPALCIIDCEGDGCGFYFHGGESPDSIVEGLTITNGSANYDGGGVYCNSSSPTLINCTISGNSASYYGGGIYCNSGSPTLTNCTISGNSANYGGGGYCYGGKLTMTNCNISGNSADNNGGGVSCYGGSPMLINCMISGNSADDYGGGVYCRYSGNPTLTNCTISGNSASDYGGGGVYCYDNSSPTLTNCIFWGDTPNEIRTISANPLVIYCDVQGAAAKPWFGEGCIDADPLFVDPDGPDDDPYTWEDNNYRLAPTSPCIDVGNNMAVPLDAFDLDHDGDTDEPLPFDLDRNPRFVDDPTVADTGVGTPPIVDMGAYEYILGDIDRDGAVDLSDLADLLGRYGLCIGDPAFHVAADFDADGCIDLSDLACLLGRYGWGA